MRCETYGSRRKFAIRTTHSRLTKSGRYAFTDSLMPAGTPLSPTAS